MKPRFTLLSGSKAGDVNMLAKLFEVLTGRKPTRQEISDAEKKLNPAKKQPFNT